MLIETKCLERNSHSEITLLKLTEILQVHTGIIDSGTGSTQLVFH